MQHMRTNLFIGAWICIFLAIALVFGMPGVAGITIAVPIAIAGSVMLIFAFLTPAEEVGMSPVEIARWAPDAEKMPRGVGDSVMYRVDTTLDSPVRSSILCGGCGHLEWVDGRRPERWDCPGCGLTLWEEDEEE